jgi:hypothetical protein
MAQTLLVLLIQQHQLHLGVLKCVATAVRLCHSSCFIVNQPILFISKGSRSFLSGSVADGAP